MKPIYVFYHMYCINNCLELFTSTFDKIQKNLLDYVAVVYVNLIGPRASELANTITQLSPKIKIFKNCSNPTGEMDTINLIHTFCQESLPANVLYLHSKGVSKPNSKNIRSWVEYMEYFNIEKWSECVDTLNMYDTCGVNLQKLPVLHYSGNFWWATSNYIKTLKPFNERSANEFFSLNPLVNSYGNMYRSYTEFWLLENSNCKPYSLHNSNINHYAEVYDKLKYTTNK
jgi:hypothetical protein